MNLIVIIKSDGEPTSPPMAQAQAQNYLLKVLDDVQNRQANLKQALNDVTSGRGKPTGSHQFRFPATNPVVYPVLHASSGNVQRSVTLFYYRNPSDQNWYIFAMGEHASATTYRIRDYGQPANGLNAAFRLNAVIAL